MNKYKVLIFDLDDTLIDNRENIRYAYMKMIEEMGEIYTDTGFERWYNIDKKFWEDRQAGLIEIPEHLRHETGKKSEEFLNWLRAQRVLIYFNNSITLEKAIELNYIYMKALTEKVIPLPGVYETLEYLKRKYTIVIATNGPQIAAKDKVAKTNCLDFVDYILSAEMCGYMKPHKEFFDAIQKLLDNYNNEEYLVIGDSLKSDVDFGMNCDFDSCWFNRNNEILPKKYQPTIIIKDLTELNKIL